MCSCVSSSSSRCTPRVSIVCLVRPHRLSFIIIFCLLINFFVLLIIFLFLFPSVHACQWLGEEIRSKGGAGVDGRGFKVNVDSERVGSAAGRARSLCCVVDRAVHRSVGPMPGHRPRRRPPSARSARSGRRRLRLPPTSSDRRHRHRPRRRRPSDRRAAVAPNRAESSSAPAVSATLPRSIHR